MTVATGLKTQIQKLAPEAMIELFELDTTTLGGELLRFHAGTNEINENIVFNSHTYIKYPVQASGFEFNGQGQFPRPKLLVSNYLSAITILLVQYGDLIGSKLTRIRTMKKFLDATNFESGINSDADPTAEFSRDIYFIDRKSAEDRDVVEFELASACDLEGISLPRRQIVQNVCQWVYRGSECGYTGPPIYDKNDNRITSAVSAEAQAVLSTYAISLAAQADLAVKQSALTAASNAKDAACGYTKLTSTFTFTAPTTAVAPTPTYGVVYNTILKTYTAYYAGSVVSIGSTYVIGDYQLTWGEGIVYFPYRLYAIETWGVNGTSCTAASSAYTAALNARNTAQTTVNTTSANYLTAMAALPSGDAIYLQEKCGKRLSSCKLRFGNNNELSFGSFPSVGLFR